MVIRVIYVVALLIEVSLAPVKTRRVSSSAEREKRRNDEVSSDLSCFKCAGMALSVQASDCSASCASSATVLGRSMAAGRRKVEFPPLRLFHSANSASFAAGMPPVSLKLVVVGDGGCGKSSITTRFLRREFSEEWDPTIEDSYQTTLTVDGTEYSIEIVDTAGQEEYRGLWGESTVRSADAFVVA